MLRTSSSRKYLPLVCLGLLALITTTLATKSRVVFADERRGHLSVTKDCSNYTGLAGSFCTIESSNIPEITNGATIFYDQPLWAAVTPATPEGNNIALDSNVVLWVATGDWAAGRLTRSDVPRHLYVFPRDRATRRLSRLRRCGPNRGKPLQLGGVV